MPRVKDVTGSFMCNIESVEQYIYLQASENTDCGIIIGVAGEPFPVHNVGIYATDRKDYSAFWREVERLQHAL